MKVDAQIEENCRRTISYLQGYSCPKLQLKETGKSETYGEYSSQCKKNNFILNAGKMNEHLFIKVTVYFPFSFGKKISTTQDIACTEISYQFLTPKVPLLIWGEIKPPTPVLQSIHFQLQRKPCIMHQSIPSAPSPPPPSPPSATAGHLLALSVPGLGWGICTFWAARGPGIWQLRGEHWIFDTHAVSYQNNIYRFSQA